MEINIKKLREIINSSQKMKYYRNPNYYYHAKFIPLLEDINPIFSIIDNGILSLSELKKHGINTESIRCKTSNGKYFICVSSNPNHFNRLFDIGFIICDEINYIKTSTDNKLADLLWNTPIPLRTGNYSDEYHVFKNIKTSYIKGIQIRLNDLLLDAPSSRNISEEEYVSRIIETVNSIYQKLEENKIDIPIINANDDTIIDKETFEKLK